MRLSTGFSLVFGLWLSWSVSLGAVNAPSFDHTHPRFTTVLKRFVAQACVDYRSLKANPTELRAYLDELAAVPEPTFRAFSENEKVAFLINLYNAQTLHLIADHYPIKSINDIGNVLRGPFDQKVVRLLGRVFTLGDLEHDILRRNHPDPRIHFALVCASVGCPPLRDEPYQSDRLGDQLDDQARRFLADPTKNRIDPKARVLALSMIFKWYEKDFTRRGKETVGTLIDYVTPYLPTAAQPAVRAGGYSVLFLAYDWSLNDVVPPAADQGR